MNFVILNQYCENRGDEAAGTALVQNLLSIKKVSRIDIIYNSAFRLDFDNAKVFHRNNDLMLKKVGLYGIIRYLLLRKTLLRKYCFANETIENMINTIRNADYIFVTPCGASIGIYKDWAFLLRLVFAVFEDKTPIFHLNTIGESGNIFFDVIAKWVLKKSKIYVRDTKSFDYIESLGLDVNKGVDTAFSLEPVCYVGKRDSIGVIVTQLGWHPDFKNLDMNKEIIENIIPGIVMISKKYNLAVELIPHLNNNDEIKFIELVEQEMIKNGINFSMVKIRSDIRTESQYDEAIANKKMIIGMRYHSIVLAAKNYIPFISLAYEYKMIEVCKYTDCTKYCLDLHTNVLASDVFEKGKEILTNYDSIINNLKNHRDRMKCLSQLPLREIKTKSTY